MSARASTCTVCHDAKCRQTNGVRCKNKQIHNLKGELYEKREQVKFWRGQCEKGICGHQQVPDSSEMGPWLDDMPCPWPNCSAGHDGTTWHARNHLGDEIVYRREEQAVAIPGWAPSPSSFRWVLDR